MISFGCQGSRNEECLGLPALGFLFGRIGSLCRVFFFLSRFGMLRDPGRSSGISGGCCVSDRRMALIAMIRLSGALFICAEPEELFTYAGRICVMASGFWQPIRSLEQIRGKQKTGR